MEALAISVRFLLYLDLMALFGLGAFGLHALRRDERVSGAVLPFKALFRLTAGLGLGLSLLGLAGLVASLGGTGLLAPDREVLEAVLFGMSGGTAWLVRVAVLALDLMLGRGGLPFGAVALASLAWGGHGAAGSWLQLGADIAHLLAAGIWIGALIAMVWLAGRPREQADLWRLHRVLRGFSSTGTAVVGVLILTGIVNLIAVTGGALPGALYGTLIVAKVTLFGLMLGLAAANRWRLVPGFETAMAEGDSGRVLGRLRASLAIEAGIGASILLIVAWLGTVDPSGLG
ncbi:putative copper resistance protein D [Sphingomonas kyeonggiensis]|uniref:Putative copper resistance protein D n=1 Tax=Sphingomonas kyeonggiensis TaxID=1268553 RepID=A0A7W7K0D4_9SPHN|nr:copper homeostasis membrane protein CopD [Sphingomonas kyeonggiensis]MBB4838721.1 putative copper resistance protein D [Sphingomonas kyeonggiensis]